MATTGNATGKVVQVIGSVLDAQFPEDQLPAIYSALLLESDVDGKSITLWCEVQQHLGGGKVRAIALGGTDGLVRGMSIKDVVMQPRQFSWTHQKKSYLPNDIDAFMQCLQSVSIAARGKDFTKGATYYHLDGTTPYWASSYNYVGSFGAHRFYN
jgi:hypothetical protein